MWFATNWNTAVQALLLAVHPAGPYHQTSPMTMSSAMEMKLHLMPVLMQTPMTVLKEKVPGLFAIWAVDPGESKLIVVNYW